MTAVWWEITLAASFGAFVTGWRMRRDLGHGAEPALALIAQGAVLWLAGTSLPGTFASFAAGTAVLFATMWVSRRWREHRDGEDR